MSTLTSFNFDPIYVIYLLVAVSVGLFVEGVYLLAFSGASYRRNVNRRLKLLRNEPNRETILVQLRKERGLTGSGDHRVGLESLSRLVLQSGLTIGLGKLFVFIAVGTVVSFAAGVYFRGSLLEAVLIALFCSTGLPQLGLRFLRNRRWKNFGSQFSHALHLIGARPPARPPVSLSLTMAPP